MADAPSSTPPPQQEQPMRPASFGATWNDSDASFLQPGAVPLPKAHRAWERQPHSPFKRNGKYRKVWKRYELRSEPEPQTSAANMEKKSPAKSPRKVVKKRALDAPADPTATPGRRAPKSKAFAPTRWETPRRHSGRIASRKIAQPIFARDPSPELANVTSATKDNNEDRGVTKDVDMSLQEDHPLEDMQDEPMAGAQEDSEAIAAPATDAKPEDDTTAEENVAEDCQLNTILSEATSQSPAVGRENEPRAAKGTEEHNAAGHDVEILAIHKSPSPSRRGTTEPGTQPRVEDVSAGGEPASEEASSGAVKSINDQEGKQADQVQPETDTAAHLASTPDGKRVDLEEEGEHLPERSENAEVVVDAVLVDQTSPNFPEAQPSESSVQNDSDNEQAEATVAQTESVDFATTVAEADVNTTTQDAEQLGSEVSSTGNPLPKETATMQEEYNISLEQQLQTDAAEALGSDSAVEEEEASLSEESSDESEHLDEDGFTLTEAAESDEDDAVNIPSPSLSAAESPKFSSIADTLTLNLPDRTPPKNRTTKEISEEPASPIDEDTAFLKDFLSRADASKASREAAVTQLETMTKRRDSDRIRQALASPRMALESKDPNSPNGASAGSPSLKAKAKDSEYASGTSALDGKKVDFGDLTSDLTLEEPGDGPPAPALAATTPKPQSNRRSSRARQTRLPAASSGPNRIQFRGAVGGDPVVLKKSDAQEIAAATRTNTRKNKGSALAAPIRLNKLKAEFLKAGTVPDAPAPDGSLPVFADPEIDVWQASKLRWDSQLAYFQEEGNLAGLTSLSDDESAEPAEIELSSQVKEESSKKRKDKSVDPPASTPARTKRAKGLGAGNGTPAKGLLAPASLLPAEVQAEMEKNDSAGEDGKKKSSNGKKASAIPPPSSSSKSGSGTSKGGKKANKTAVKEAQPAVPTETPAPLQESNSKSDTVQPTPAPAPAPTAQAPPPPSQLPAPASRRSRLQTPRKVKLPVPVSSSFLSSSSSTSGIPAVHSPAPAKPTPAPAAQNKDINNVPGRLIGSTPRKMAGIAKPSAAAPGGGGADTGNATTQGLSAGRRRAGTRRT